MAKLFGGGQARSAEASALAPSTFFILFTLYTRVAKLISACAPARPHIRKRGCPKMRYLRVAKGCSTVDLRSRMTAGVGSFVRPRFSPGTKHQQN